MMGITTTVDLTGNYFSLAKIITMIVFMPPWLLTAPWVQRDAKRVLVPATMWSTIVLAAGGVGMGLWLLIGNFWVGMIIYILLYVAAASAYVMHRNSQVASEHRLLTSTHFKKVVDRRTDKVAVETKVRIYNCDGKSAAPPTEKAPIEQRMAYNLAQALVNDLLFQRASEADISPATDETTRLRFIVDGVIVDQPEWELTESDLVIQYLKGLGGMDVSDTRRPQKGRISVDLAGMTIDMELTTTGTRTGQRIQFKVLQESIQTDLTQLGMDAGTLQRVSALNQTPTGLFLVASRGRNGKTSTLYSMLRQHDAYMQSLGTVEADPATDLLNITQIRYKDEQEQSKAISSLIRQDTDVILIDQCESTAVADQIADVADEKNVLLGITAADAFTALAKWVQLASNPAKALAPLKAVLCGVLVRKLCPDCREAYAPDPNVLAKANLRNANIEHFYRPPTGPLLDDKGRPMVDKQGNPIPCPTCRGTGYFGREGAFELLKLTDDIRQAVLKGESLAQIKIACRHNNMRYLQENALQKVIAGTTSIQEVIRVTQSKKKKK
jgi:type II secretory ATPase GspE/PulE/Tfp pilus assembly ATPase PilB-like protein